MRNYIAEALSVFTYTIMTITVFLQEWSPSLTTTVLANTKIASLIEMEIGFYIGYLIVDLWRRDLEQCIHHIIAIAILYLGNIIHYHQFVLNVLFLFSLSNPFLTVSKIVYKMKMQKTSRVAFACFAIVFFLARCVGGGWLMYTSFDSMKDHDHYIFIVCNCFGAALYIMQLMWLQRIIRILFKPNIV